jgi:hypothetical protein
MKLYVTTSPVIARVAWLRRYSTALIVVALVALATLGVGVAQALYSNAAPHATVVEAGVTTHVALDQHERHTSARETDRT